MLLHYTNSGGLRAASLAWKAQSREKAEIAFLEDQESPRWLKVDLARAKMEGGWSVHANVSGLGLGVRYHLA